MKPQNDPTLSEAVSVVVQSSLKLNHLMAEGKMHEVANLLGKIERNAGIAQYCIPNMADLLG